MRDDGDGRVGLLGSGGGIQNTVTTDTTVTGSVEKVKGAYLRVEISRREIQPEPLCFFPRKTLAARGKATLFLLPNG